MTTGPSNKFVEVALKRADEALRGARMLLNGRELYGAVSRSYYCLFHAAEAVLYSRGIRAKSHAGLRSLFGEHIVKPGLMSREFADILRDAFNARQLSDYEVYAVIGLEEVTTLVDKAEHFVDAAKDLLKRK
ncbi:MAG: HEPN domain-containing protein [Chloroflexi bacterium]|nr:HEPN domain-containing protein [Chloroflexota bacterium]